MQQTGAIPTPKPKLSIDSRPKSPFQHYRIKAPRRLTESEKRRVTVLFGGATWKHERLMQGALERLGYKAEPLPEILHRDLLAGKDYVDAGACCPTAFTAGNLINFLRDAVAQRGAERVVRDYVFVTEGGCGPCRFGQYQESYALALRCGSRGRVHLRPAGHFRRVAGLVFQQHQRDRLGREIRRPLSLDQLCGEAVELRVRNGSSPRTRRFSASWRLRGRCSSSSEIWTRPSRRAASPSGRRRCYIISPSGPNPSSRESWRGSRRNVH